MTNGANDWGVSFSKITWVERLLRTHENVAELDRQRDIYFTVKRKAQNDSLAVLACDEYAAGMEVVLRALSEFGKIDIIHVGGGWCGYTKEAKDYCIENRIGIYVTDEMSGALWKREYWAYHKRDKDGNPFFYYKSA